jgi:predicted acetyltransferase
MALEMRAINADEVDDFRTAVRWGFGEAETQPDHEWARDVHSPVDRALATYDDGRMVATLRSFPTDLSVPGGARIDAGALTAVTCHPTHRRQGVLTQMITADLRSSKERGEAADVLIASEYPIYGRFGYGPAVLSTAWHLQTSKAKFAYAGEGTIEFIDNETLRKEAPAIFDRVRRERAGMIDRNDLVWDNRTDLRRPAGEKPWVGFRLLCRDADGVAQGWASYTLEDKWDDMVADSTAKVADLCAATPAAEARLLQFLAELDLVRHLKVFDRPADDLVQSLITDARAVKELTRVDFLWVRLLDVVSALEARTYDVAGRVVLEVSDELGLANGRFLLDASPDGATCTPTDEPAELTMPVRTLGAAYLGGRRLAQLARARWLDVEDERALTTADLLFATALPPWCNTWF